MRNLFTNLGLLLGSCLVGLLLCEVSLRLFYPKYRDLAQAQFRQDERRLWARTPHARNRMHHPDTGLSHPFDHNNLALRQHRNFSEADLASATNVGVFGDSFVENAGMDAPYSFTEPLDYLLNQSGRRFNVLNFGVSGYGTGQSFLHYANFRYAQDLDYVVYVYCEGDLWNISKNGLFSLDDAGDLVENAPLPPGGWVRFVSSLHLSYLLLDVQGRLSSHIRERRREYSGQVRARRQPFDTDWKQSLPIFKKLLRRWKHLVESKGSVFRVVSLPDGPLNPSPAAVFSEEEIEVIDLYDCFTGFDAAHAQRRWHHSPYRFENDWHWNEAGNRLAAVCLYQVLAEEMRLPTRIEADLRTALDRYYAVFDGRTSTNFGGGGSNTEVPSQAAIAIREKYQAFRDREREVALKKAIQTVVATPTKRIIRSTFDVYLDDRSLVYIKEGCRPADTRSVFFLHVTPVDEDSLSVRRRDLGFANLDFYFPGIMIDDTTCATLRRLPAYPIRHIRTGQFVRDAQGNYAPLWEEEFVMEQSARDVERQAGN